MAWLTTASLIPAEGNYDTWDDVHDLAWASAYTLGVDLLTSAAFKFPREVAAKLDTTPAGPAAPIWQEGIILPAPQAPVADLTAGSVSPRPAPTGDQQ